MVRHASTRGSIEGPTRRSTVYVEALSEVGRLIKGRLQEHRERPALTPQEEVAWRDAEVCHLCESAVRSLLRLIVCVITVT